MVRLLGLWLVAAVFITQPTRGQLQETSGVSLTNKSVKTVSKDFPISLFTAVESKLQTRGGLPILQTMRADPQAIAFVFRNRPERVSFHVFINGIARHVQLHRVNLFAPDFVAMTAGRGPVPYERGSYYSGTVEGQEGTLAVFSFFEKKVVGLLAYPTEHTLTISQGDEPDKYWIYAERFEADQMPTLCHTETSSFSVGNLLTELREPKCVRLHYEVGYDIFQQCGSDVTQTLNWMTALHNNVQAVFQIDSISTAISQIFIWDLPDPYNASNASGQLSLFREHRPQLGGDLGQLLTMESGSLGGIAASLNGFCTLLYNYSYSDIEFAYEQVPLYSWTTHVILHEFGHLMGSPHTHNCSWPNGAIDGCAPLVGIPNEGNCPNGPLPENGGTVMSFCHLTQYGVNLALGFGELPAQLMKSYISNASCLTPDCPPMMPAYCPSKGDTKWEWIQEAHFNNISNISGQRAIPILHP
jgi:Reprolysin (M12B) family zinc metalloprotease.